MAMSNPAFSAKSFATPAAAAAKVSTQVQPGLSAEQLQEIYNRPSAGPAETDRMTYENTIVKTVITLAFVVGGGAIGYNIPALMLPFALVGFVLALVNIFKKQPSPALVLAYAVAQGIFVGGLSGVVEASAPGIIFQALVGTGIVFGVTLALFANGKVRASKKATKIFMIAGISYLVFSLFNVVTAADRTEQRPVGPGKHRGVRNSARPDHRTARDPHGRVLAGARLHLREAGRRRRRSQPLGLEGGLRHHADDHLALRRDPAPDLDHPRQ